MECPVVNCRNVRIGKIELLDHVAEGMVSAFKRTRAGFNCDIAFQGDKLVNVMISPKPVQSTGEPFVLCILHGGIVEETWIVKDQLAASMKVVEVFTAYGKIVPDGRLSEDVAKVREFVGSDSWWDYVVVTANQQAVVLSVPDEGAA